MFREINEQDLVRCFSYVLNYDDIARFSKEEGIDDSEIVEIKRNTENLFNKNTQLILSLEDRLLIYNYCFLYSFLDRNNDVVSQLRLQLNITQLYDKILNKIFSDHSSVNEINDRLSVFINPSDEIVQLIENNISAHKKEGFYNSFIKLDGLPYSKYEHPKDRSALNTLEGTPGIEAAVKFFNKHAVDKYSLIQHRGSYFKVNERNNKRLIRILDECCEALDIDEKPELYLQTGFINGYTVGVESNIIVISTAMETILSTDEIKFVIGHELGHIKSNHTLYLQMAGILPTVASFIPIPGINTVISTALKIPMYYWYRMAEYTADRAGLLACQNLEAAISVFAKASGLPLSRYFDFDINEFLEQAEDLEEFNESNLDKSIQAISIMFADHPWIMSRAKELKNWVDSGEYSKILTSTYDTSKTYVRGTENSVKNDTPEKDESKSVTDRLVHLKHLKDKGLISQEDFDAKKSFLLSQI